MNDQNTIAKNGKQIKRNSIDIKRKYTEQNPKNKKQIQIQTSKQKGTSENTKRWQFLKNQQNAKTYTKQWEQLKDDQRGK